MTHINFEFSKTGVIKIKANYEYLNFDNIRHTHIYLFKNNNISFHETHADHYSNIVNDEFSIPAIECENVHFTIFLVNPLYDNSKITLNKNNIEFIYNDFTKIQKTDYNIDNVTSNLEKITANESSISSNSGKISTNEGNISSNSGQISTNEENISSNLEKINALQTSNIKAFYNLDEIFIATAMGSINKLSTIKSVFIVPINKNMTKIKIDFIIMPKPTQQNRSAKFIIKDINTNKIYVKYFQKTEEMSIKNIEDSLNKLYLKNL